jgi:hypothetical protein
MKWIKELHAQVWTVCGTLLVLYTLTGQTLRLATTTFAIAIGLHFLGVLLPSEDSEPDS